VEDILKDGARLIGVAIAGTINLLAPDMIVLGGGLVEALPKLFVEGIEEALSNHVMPSYIGTYSVQVARLGDDAGAMGAAAWGRRAIEDRRTGLKVVAG
jgi:glucokinase